MATDRSIKLPLITEEWNNVSANKNVNLHLYMNI